MEEVKQSLQQKTGGTTKRRISKKRTICNRQSVYISGEIQKTYHADCRRDYWQTGKYRKFH